MTEVEDEYYNGSACLTSRGNWHNRHTGYGRMIFSVPLLRYQQVVAWSSKADHPKNHLFPGHFNLA